MSQEVEQNNQTPEVVAPVQEQTTTNQQPEALKKSPEELILEGKTVRISASEAIDILSKNEKLSSMNSQSGKNIVADIKQSIKSPWDLGDPNIIVRFNKDREGNILFIYWSYCDFDNILANAGIKNFSLNSKMYDDALYVKLENRTSVMGKDIKKAFSRISEDELNNNPLLAAFKQDYIDAEHPIGDGIFYSIFMKVTKEGDKITSQNIRCTRNQTLSPRPIKKPEQ